MNKILLFMNQDCAPCKQIKSLLPMVLSGIKKEVKVEYLNTCDNPEYASKYKVWSQPMTILMRDNKEIYRHEGAYLDVKEIIKEINNAI